jgi:GPH family glycoside/pentoside/hexuronide:cation symporter
MSAAPLAVPLPSEEPGQSASDERVSLRMALAYGFPNIAGVAMLVPILIHMPKFYADVVLVPLGYLAIAIAVARALDALSDPFIGWLSDRTHTRWGRRRPYMAVGAPLCALAFWALFSPPPTLSSRGSALWFGVTFVLYFVFHTLYSLPHYALGPELTLDYHERSRLFGVREGFSILGTIGASIAPGVLAGWDFTPRAAFAGIGWVNALLLVISFWMLVAVVRERHEFATRESNPFVPGVRRALRNRQFRILLLTYVVGSVAGAIPGTLMPFFNSYVIRPANEERWLAIFLGTYFLSAFVTLPLWVALARRVGKRAAWLASFVLGITGGAAMFFLGEGDTVALLVLLVWAGSGFGAGLFLGPAVQADVIDYDELHTGKRREAQYSAFWGMLPKFVAIPSAAIPISILGSLGYVPNAVQNPRVVLAIKAIFALTPALCSALAFLFARRFAIDAQAHAAILAGIVRHRRGESVVDPLTGAVLDPPRARAVDEATGWFLDHFSAGELRRALAQGGRRAVRDVRRSALAALAVCIGCIALVTTQVTSFEIDPGAVPVLAIVGAGFSFAVFVFHLLRLPAARELARGRVPPDLVRAHLDAGGSGRV